MIVIKEKFFKRNSFKVKMKIDELFSLHARHLMRPVLEENETEDEMRENLAQETTKLLLSAHRKLQAIRSVANSSHSNKMEQRLWDNVCSSLWLSLQNLIQKFRNGQNNYLNQIKQREESSNVFFEDLNFDKSPITVDSFDNFIQPAPTSSSAVLYSTEIDYIGKSDEQIDEYFQISMVGKGNMQQQQQLFIEMDNTKLVEAREQDVTKIVKSIVDLNVVFRELSSMIQEQGTILDRIDYNIETTQVSVNQGYQQLQKAAQYQRKNRKLYCIVVLASVTLFMLMLLIATKI
jgi:syntaxin 16